MNEARGLVADVNPGAAAQLRLTQQLEELDLLRNVAELDAAGYTVVPDAAPLELFDEIKQAIVDITAESHARGVDPFNFGPNTSMVYRLLAKHTVFGKAVLTPKLTALMTYLLGGGYVAQVTTGSILHPESRAGHLHADNQFFPEPFPVQVHVATAIWCCDDFNEENGSTHLVAGSHRLFRHPRPGEGRDRAVAVEAPRGSIVIWSGHTWHSSGGRTAPGKRVALHTGFSRPHIRPFEAYSPDEVEPLVDYDQRFARLLGADLPYEYSGDSPELDKLLALASTTQTQA
jgi:hypothetical protein